MLIEEELEFEGENKVEEIVVDDTEEIDSEVEVEEDDGEDDDEDDDDADEEEEEEDDDDDVQEVFQSSGSGPPAQPVEADDDRILGSTRG